MEQKNKLGLASIILLGVNAVVGSGIFLLPGKSYSLMGPNVLYVYIFLTLVIMAIAMCFAEAGSMFTRTGGAYVYTREAFGEFAGFEVGFMRWCISMIAWAAMAVGFATALGAVWSPASTTMGKDIISAFIILVLSLINLGGVDLTKYVNNIATIGKMIPLIAVAIIGIFFIKGSNFAPVPGLECHIDNFAQASMLIFYAFTGFEVIGIAAGDMKNPKKDLPKAIIFSMALISIIYFLIQLVCIGVLGTSLENSNAPFTDAAIVMFGSVGGWIVTIGTLASIGGINIASSFVSPRGAVALAEDHLFPTIIAKQNSRGVATGAVIITAIPAILIALSGTFVQLAIISVVARLIAQYIPTCLSVLRLRKRQDITGTFRAPLGYVCPVGSVIICLFLLSKATQIQLVAGFSVLVLGGIVYFIMKKTATAK